MKAGVDVQTAIAEAMPLLPAGMPSPPTFRKQNPADQDILQLALVSNTVPMSVLDDYAETVIAPRISMVNGVAQVQVLGPGRSTPCACRSIPTSWRRSRSASTKSIRRCRTGTSTCRPASCSARTRRSTLKAGGQLKNADQFKPIIVTYRQGAPVRLEQVANVLDSVEDTMNATWFYTREGGQRAINLALKRQPGVEHHRGHRRRPRAAAGPRSRSCRRRFT